MPMCLGADAPAMWYSLSEMERVSRALLSSDQCIIDEEHFFVRGRVVLPIDGGVDSFAWLVWVSLSAANFQRMSELWETEGRESPSLLTLAGFKALYHMTYLLSA